MALPIKNFRGKLKGKTTYTYTKQLNYSLETYDERRKLLDEILSEKNDDFFVEYFDDFHKVNVNKEDFLSIDRNVCNSLEKMADYLLYTKEAKNDGEWKVKYNFYTDKTLDIKNEKDYKRRTETIMFLVDKAKNYRKQVLQEITKEDFKDSDFNTEIKYYNINNPNEYYIEKSNYLKNYYDFILKCSDELKTYREFKRKKDVTETMKDIKTICIYLKDKIKGTIYFEDCLSESEDINWFLINFTDIDHILGLLKIHPRDLIDELGILVYDLNNLLNQIEISEFEKEVINLWRKNDYTQEIIAEKLKVSQPFISASLKNIGNKIIKQYKENYEDWLYLNYLKGNYKTCSTCGGVKLVQRFNKDKQKNDGYKYHCKKCEK